MYSEPRNILLVVDDPAFADFARPLLRDQGCSITHAATAAKALYLVDQLRFDLVITSLIAPGLDVIDFLNAMAERIAGTPMIAIDGSARTVRNIVAQAPATLRGSGVVLSSPVKADDLINTVSVLMASFDPNGAGEAERPITYH